MASVNQFCQNLYLYGSGPLVAHYQQQLLADSALVERLVLPYLEASAPNPQPSPFNPQPTRLI